MADSTITGLTDASALAGADSLPIVQGGLNREATMTQVATYVSANLTDGSVALADMANIATDSIIGRATASTGAPEVLTALPFAFTGDVTRAADSNVTVLAAGSAGALNSGTLAAARMPALTGDVTTSAGAVATTIANDAVTYAKMQNVSATSRVLGRITGGAGDVEELTGANVRTIAGLATTDSPEFTAINVGAASDTTVTRVSAGVIAVEGSEVVTSGATQTVAGAKTFTGKVTITEPSASGVVALELNHPGNATFGTVVEVRTTGGTDRPRLAFVSNVDSKNWSIGSDSVDATAGWGVFENGSASASGTRQLGIRAGGTVALTVDMVVGSPSGGAKGTGTINATAVYDDNTLLTCAPVELLTDGKFDQAAWNALVPDKIIPAVTERRDTGRKDEEGNPVIKMVEVAPERAEPREHEVVKIFARMMTEGFDPRDPDNFVQRMKADGSVPGLITRAEWVAMKDAGEKPDMGHMATRTFLAIDNLAVAFAGLLERNAALEARITALEV